MKRKNIIGWLSPTGEFYECDCYGHSDLAINLMVDLKLQVIEKDGVFYKGEALLEELGWIRFTQTKFYDKYEEVTDKGFAFCNYDKSITYAQLKWVNENRKILSPCQLSELDDYIGRGE